MSPCLRLDLQHKQPKRCGFHTWVFASGDRDTHGYAAPPHTARSRLQPFDICTQVRWCAQTHTLILKRTTCAQTHCCQVVTYENTTFSL